MLLYSYISTVGWPVPVTHVVQPGTVAGGDQAQVVRNIVEAANAADGDGGGSFITNAGVAIANSSSEVRTMVAYAAQKVLSTGGIVGTATLTGINPYTWLRLASKAKRILQKDQTDSQDDLIREHKLNRGVPNDTSVWPYTRTNPNEPLIYRIKHLIYESETEKMHRYYTLREISKFQGHDLNDPRVILLLEKYSGYISESPAAQSEIDRLAHLKTPTDSPVAGPSNPLPGTAAESDNPLPYELSEETEIWSEHGGSDGGDNGDGDMTATIRPPKTVPGPIPEAVTSGDLETTPKGKATNPTNSFGSRRVIGDRIRNSLKKPLAALDTSLNDPAVRRAAAFAKKASQLLGSDHESESEDDV